MSKNKLARALSARHEEERINCAKNCPPTCKETGNWKSEESPTSQSRLCRGGASLQIPKPLPEAQAAWGGEKALPPLLPCTLTGIHSSSWQEPEREVFPSVGIEGNFNMTGAHSRTIPRLDQNSFLPITPAFSFTQDQAYRLQPEFSTMVVAPWIQSSQEPNLSGAGGRFVRNGQILTSNPNN